MPPRKKLKTNVEPTTPVRRSARSAAARLNQPTTASKPRGKIPHRDMLMLPNLFKKLQDIPLDVLYEILGRLHPTDLLNLSRTTKELRRLLLNRANSSIWTQSLHQVPGLPPCPTFLSGPAYAHLLFEQICHSCYSTTVRNVIWLWFTRYCSKCLPDLRYDQISIQPVLKGFESDGNPVFGGASYQELFSVIVESAGRRGHKMHKLQVEDFVQQWSVAETEEARSQLLARQMESIQAIELHASQCEEWSVAQSDSRAADQDALVEQRIAEITQRLRDAGWGPDLDYMDARNIPKIRDFPIVRYPSQLTDKGYARVFGALREHLEKTREARIRKEPLRKRAEALQDAIVAHYAKLPRTATSLIRPQVTDLAFMDECKALLTAPPSDNITQKDFATLVPILGARWEAECRAWFGQWVRTQLEGIPEDVDPLNLAVAFFGCKHMCSSGERVCLRYPEILGHTCVRYRDTDWRRPIAVEDITFERDLNELYALAGFPAAAGVGAGVGRKWNMYPLPPEKIYSRYLCNMFLYLRKVGLDPYRTTLEELQRHDSRVVVQFPGDWLVWNWGATLHYETWHNQRGMKTEDLPGLDAAQPSNCTPVTTDGKWCCALCTDHESEFGPKSAMEMHMVAWHVMQEFDVEEGLRQGTIFVHPDVVYSSGLHPVLKLPRPAKQS